MEAPVPPRPEQNPASMGAMSGSLPAPDVSLHTVGREDGGHRGRKQRELLEHFGLRPASSVLEIGCGVGRLAYELADYFEEGGSYAGFDISEVAIEWLNDHYAPVLPNFRFDFIDVSNPRFNPGGREVGGQLRFPHPDAGFDLVCAFEVFMHMERDDVAGYLREVARVLRPGGRAVLTFMAVYDDAEPGRHFGRDFVPLGDGVYTRLPDRTGWSLGYHDDLIRQMVSDGGLRVDDTVEGSWHRPLEEPDDGPQHGCDVYVVSPIAAR